MNKMIFFKLKNKKFLISFILNILFTYFLYFLFNICFVNAQPRPCFNLNDYQELSYENFLKYYQIKDGFVLEDKIDKNKNQYFITFVRKKQFLNKSHPIYNQDDFKNIDLVKNQNHLDKEIGGLYWGSITQLNKQYHFDNIQYIIKNNSSIYIHDPKCVHGCYVIKFSKERNQNQVLSLSLFNQYDKTNTVYPYKKMSRKKIKKLGNLIFKGNTKINFLPYIEWKRFEQKENNIFLTLKALPQKELNNELPEGSFKIQFKKK
jgi:hypothetical protein